MSSQHRNLFAIVADVGGTRIRFGSLITADAQLQCIEVYECSGFGGLEDALRHYQAQLSRQGLPAGSVKILCLALPGDVQSEPVRLANLSWTVDPASLAREFDCRVLTVNDFSAQAHAIPALQDRELQWLRAPSGRVDGMNRAIIGPGTGLGVSALLPDGQVVESEGGHISFAPQDELQARLLASLWPAFPRLSVERLISGPGLANLYRAVGLIEGDERRRLPEEITALAGSGDPRSRKTIALFTQIFGSVCGDLALALGAKGGIYLSGGLLQGLGELFDGGIFLEQFSNKGRYSDYCRQIPVARVLTLQPGLLGAVRYVRLQGENSD